jgi:hypothetical protein
MANIFRRMLVWPYEQWLIHRRVIGDIAGIILIDDGKNTPQLRETFATALEIIQRRDLRRYKRVLAHIRRIMNFPIGYAGAGYIPHLRAYATSFESAPSEATIRKKAILYAASLVHEATHGLLCARKIPYNTRTRERIERLCTKEEHRFLSHVLTRDSLTKISDYIRYDPHAYRKRWSLSFWQRSIEGLRYHKEQAARLKQRDATKKT